jgi:hypothetical protein
MVRLSLKTHVAEILTKKLTSIPQRLFSPADLAEIFTQTRPHQELYASRD